MTLSSRPAPPRSGARDGRLAFGIVILLVGVGWLLSAVGVAVPWHVLLPVALMLVGALLLLTAGAGRHHGGLIALGIVLTIVLAAGATADVSIAGSTGARTVRPTAPGQIAHEYSLGAGDLTLDLRGVALRPGTTRVRASVGAGQLVVRVPAGLAVHVEARSGIGQVVVLGRTSSGFGVHETFQSPGYAGAARRLWLDLSTGTGQVEVTR